MTLQCSFFCNFIPMETTEWSENVILVDADYVDRVVFNLTVNFERMLNRPIPKADLAQWLVCVALDGGIPQGENEVQVILVHGKGKSTLENFVPADFKEELDGKAFRDPYMGEFRLSAVQVENMVSSEELFAQSLETLADTKEIKRMMIVPDMEAYAHKVRPILSRVNGKDVTLLAMEPQTGSGFKQEILGYSLMNAMGIKGDEFK